MNALPSNTNVFAKLRFVQWNSKTKSIGFANPAHPPGYVPEKYNHVIRQVQKTCKAAVQISQV
jgi:hypothetical protein